MEYNKGLNSTLNAAHIDDPEERRITAALRATNIGVFEFEPHTGRAYWDDRVREIWNVPKPEDITYETVIAQVHPDDIDLHNEGTQNALDPQGDGRLDITYRLFPRGGEPMRWLHAVGECYFVDGVAMRLVGTVQDITVTKSAEIKNQLLLHELEHRVKNTLATAIAVVDLSRVQNTDINAYFHAVEERLRALANSVDLLRSSAWEAVFIDDLVHRISKGFLSDGASRLHLKGHSIRVSAQHVMTLSMALHELFTNAAKYGALSVPNGEIHITTLQNNAQQSLVWEEVGGPTPTTLKTPRSGFGSMLLDQILPAGLGANVTRDLQPSGLTFKLKMPISNEDNL